MRATERGFAEKIDFDTMTTQSVKKTLRKILTDPKYMENAKKLSTRFRDQKELPLERAVWWAEWLIRNPDCDYLKSPVLRLGFIVGNSYDIIAAICFVSFVTLISIITMTVLIFCKLKSYRVKIRNINKSKGN